MASENYYQARLIGKIKAEGGWGRKWATQYSVGVPDLILVHPSFNTFFMEVKLIRNVSYKNFMRKVATTGLQKHSMEQIISAGGKAGVGIFIQRQGAPAPPIEFTMVPWWTEVIHNGQGIVDFRRVDVGNFISTFWEDHHGE